MLPNPQPYFAKLPDPRRETLNKRHKLEDIVMITLCAVLGGYEDWVSIEDFGYENEEWLRGFLELPNGIPSHDTLSVVMGKIKREAFEVAFLEWMRAGLPSLSEKQIAVDGKSLRGSRKGNSLVHMVSAFVVEARLVLAAQSVEEKGNEITAIPDLLAQLDIKGAIVTMDAMGCQKAIAGTIIEQKADYVLTLKENHPLMLENVKSEMEKEHEEGYVRLDAVGEKGHGRTETRRTSVSTKLDWLKQKNQWPGLQAVAMVESTREINGKTSKEYRYYLSSMTDAHRIEDAIRHHWAIENQQHWILDVQFGEDAHRARKNHSAANLALIRRTALNLLQQDRTDKRSIRRRKMRALSDLGYREKLLFGDAFVANVA